MCRERGDWVFSIEHRVERVLLGGWQNNLEIWRNMVGDLEKLVRRKHWRFGETWSAIWRNSFGKNVGDLEKCGRRFGETCLAKTLEIWRKVVGELEKLVRRKRCRFGEMWSAQLWRFRIGVRYGVA